MKRVTLRLAALAVLCIGFALLGPAATHAQGLGIAGGINYDDFSDIEADTDRAQGYHIGLFYDVTLGPLALRPGIFYMDVGDIETSDTDAAQESFELQLIEIPVDARFRIGAAPLLKPYLMAGPVLRINASSDDFEGDAEDFSLAANAGAGLELTLPGSGLRLYPEVRYAFGISDFADDVGGISTADDSSARLNSFMLRLGIAF